jgi:hypothetical protein
MSFFSLAVYTRNCQQFLTFIGTHWNTLEHNVTHWNTLEHIGTHWNTMEHIGTHLH